MLKLKVCGLKNPQNIKEIAELEPAMMGFVFHKGSPRDVSSDQFNYEIPSQIEKVGVFVDSDLLYVESVIKRFQLNAIQLYHEDLKPFQRLRAKVKLVKAISIGSRSDIYKTRAYLQDCDLFLFDAKGENAGGNGIKFNWEILETYSGGTPFFLSGGIAPEDASLIKEFKHKNLIGIDINSKFELSRGIKNTELVKQFKNELHENIEYHR
jgi:phosphoribosylanthranilate isomerase